MTSTYGRSGGITTQMAREGSDITMASVTVVATETDTILAAPGAGSYYLIWGATVCNTGASALGFIESLSTSEDILAYACSIQGPMVMSFSMPIRLADNTGVRIRQLAGSLAGETTLAAVYYTTHET